MNSTGTYAVPSYMVWELPLCGSTNRAKKGRGYGWRHSSCIVFAKFLAAVTMDVEQLHVVLQQSFSPDSTLRVPAEETIRNLKHIKGATTLLLQVAAEKQVSTRRARTPEHTNSICLNEKGAA